MNIHGKLKGKSCWIYTKIFLVFESTLLVMCLLCITQEAHAEDYDKSWLLSKFNDFDLVTNNGDGYSKYTNETGALAWSESYILDAYLDMYEATRDDKYLDKFVIHVDRIIANTDVNRGVSDYKGRSAVGWSATIYSKNGERIIWLVHTGMITYPLVRFALIVQTDNVITYKNKAEYFMQISEEALSFFDRNWVQDDKLGEGYYQFDVDSPHTTNVDPPMPVPFNQQLAAGRTFLVLYQLTNKRFFYEKAEGLARHFIHRLRKEINGTCTWNYSYDKGFKECNAVEDISHGATDIDFAVLAYRNGIIFNKEDIFHFINTYKINIHKNGKFANTVSGIGEGTYKESIGRWLELSKFDCFIWNNFYDMVKNDNLSGGVEILLGIAKLLKYWDRCNKQ